MGVYAVTVFTALSVDLPRHILTGLAEVGPAFQAAAMFQAAVHVGDLETAYRQTTDEYQRQQSWDEFVALLRRHPEAADHWDWSTMECIERAADRFTFRVPIQDATQGRGVEITVRKKGEADWRVDGFSVQLSLTPRPSIRQSDVR
jgi:hypothetical protein